jgi:TetR/AcrR family transcriptional regulator, transcriptional repressor of aconitase
MARVTAAHTEARKNQIIQAAWECFARKGYYQTKMADIAREAGLSAGAIYRYFPGKEAVLKAISERSLERDLDLMERARASEDEPIAALELLSLAMRSTFQDPAFETLARMNVELRPEFLRNEDLKRSMRKNLRVMLAAASLLISEAKRKGQIKPNVDPEALAMLSLCFNEGLRQYRLVDPQTFKVERLIDLLRELVSEPHEESMPAAAKVSAEA